MSNTSKPIAVMSIRNKTKKFLLKIIINLLIFLKQDYDFSRPRLVFTKNIQKPPHKLDREQLGQLIRFMAHALDKGKKCVNNDGLRGAEKHRLLEASLDEWQKREYEWGPDKQWAKDILTQHQRWCKGTEKLIERVPDDESFSGSNELFSVMEERRSVRFWKKKRIPGDLINKIIKMATYAPTSCNRMAWKFLVVENDVQTMADGDSTNRSMLEKAPVRIYVAVDERLYPEIYAPALDAGLALQNMILAAHALGLGCCLVYQCESVDQTALKKSLKIPEFYRIYCAVLLGYPNEKPLRPERIAVNEVTSYVETNAGLPSFLVK